MCESTVPCDLAARIVNATTVVVVRSATAGRSRAKVIIVATACTYIIAKVLPTGLARSEAGLAVERLAQEVEADGRRRVRPARRDMKAAGAQRWLNA